MLLLIVLYPEQALQSKHEENLLVSSISEVLRTAWKVTKIAEEKQNTTLF